MIVFGVSLYFEITARNKGLLSFNIFNNFHSHYRVLHLSRIKRLPSSIDSLKIKTLLHHFLVVIIFYFELIVICFNPHSIIEFI